MTQSIMHLIFYNLPSTTQTGHTLTMRNVLIDFFSSLLMAYAYLYTNRPSICTNLQLFLFLDYSVSLNILFNLTECESNHRLLFYYLPPVNISTMSNFIATLKEYFISKYAHLLYFYVIIFIVST